ncbi:hypothetical protein BC835DRAFT_1304003 [Cytidiella melzeri]|nr:hypothetical protein BC835DRAFT_1304003 [Cytidiella melzeri]
MEDLVNDEGIDLESLQAQIDISLAQTQNLVASWLKPTRGESSSTSSSRLNQEKEIQELLKRPPRLGVGAPIPASTGIVGHETMKLKGKLSGKKRGREPEDVDMAVSAEQSDGDEEESRAGAIKKKARVDPFAGSRAKGKKKQTAQSSDPTEPRQPSPKTPPLTEAQNSVDTVESPKHASNDVIGASPAGKKKKKKKKRHGNADAADVHGMQAVTKPISAFDRPHTPPAGSSKSEVSVTPVHLSTQQVAVEATPNPSTQAHELPLLNLVGPPPAADSSPTKKKRKKNKKKRKKVEDLVTLDPEPETEGQDDDEAGDG